MYMALGRLGEMYLQRTYLKLYILTPHVMVINLADYVTCNGSVTTTASTHVTLILAPLGLILFIWILFTSSFIYKEPGCISKDLENFIALKPS